MKYTITNNRVSFHNESRSSVGVMAGPPSVTLAFLGLVLDVQSKRMLRKHGACIVTV